MERESFESQVVAKVLNEHFVSIKASENCPGRLAPVSFFASALSETSNRTCV